MAEQDKHEYFMSLLRGKISESEACWSMRNLDEDLYKEAELELQMQILERKFDELFGGLEDKKKA